MVYKSSDLAIIIPSNNHQNINICLNSIKNQTKKPGQTIFVFNNKTNFKSNKKFIFAYTNISNQVYQRNFGLKLMNKKIKLILQLDDKFYLHKRAVQNLIKEWNATDKDVAGIGIESNFVYQNENKLHFFKYVTLTGSEVPGKVLKSGFNNELISKSDLKNVDWLQGGLSSWRLKYVPIIFNRKYPLVKWSILEDLIFSYHIKFKKKYRLQFNKGIKAYFIRDKDFNYNFKEFFYRGYEYARMHKVFVYKYKETLSKIAFYYSYISSSILGFSWNLFTLNKKLFFYLGRLKGIFANIKEIRVL